MEYVDGDTLSNMRLGKSRRVFEAGDLRTWMKQLCEALSYAHEKVRMVHRDMKPSNLLLNSQNDLKLSDFGIARSVSDTISRVTIQRPTSGTLIYMSPQQMAGDPTRVTDDIYALGATIYDLMTSKPPFYSGNIIQQVQEKIPPTMSDRRYELEIKGDEIPVEWEEAVGACLSKDESERPQSAREIAERLDLEPKKHILRSPKRRMETVEFTPPPPEPELVEMRDLPDYDSQPSLATSWLPFIFTFVMVILMAGWAGWHFFVRLPAEKEKTRQTENTEGAEGGDWRNRTGTEVKTIKNPLERSRHETEAKKRGVPTIPVKERKVPVPGQGWENSLGMIFAPVGDVLFSVWETRVQDFETFVTATNYDATGNMYSLGIDGWKKRDGTWRDPGFSQGAKHPVAGVSWEDAIAFCNWLTEKEQAAGLLTEGQRYRLPIDREWSDAAGYEQYPWEGAWPPPDGAGNYGGIEVLGETWPSNWTPIAGYRDGFTRTAPVGSFKPNKHGLYNMGGNVLEWCKDWYRQEMNSTALRNKYQSLNDDGGGEKFRVLRGGSWSDYEPDFMRLSFRNGNLPNTRNDYYGFRCVLIPSGPSK